MVSGNGAGSARNIQCQARVGEAGIHAVPHRPGRHDVEHGELFEPPGVVEREPIGDAAAAVVPGEAKAHVAERLHHLDHRTAPWRAWCRARASASDGGASDQP